MTLFDILTIAYIVVGVTLAVTLIVAAWRTREAPIFLFGVVGAGFLPALWGPILVFGGGTFLILWGIQTLMDGTRR